MEEWTKDLIALSEQEIEVVKQLEATGLLKAKREIDQAIELIKNNICEQFEAGMIEGGKRELKISNEDVLGITLTRGGVMLKVTDVNEVDDMFREDLLMEGAKIIDDEIYLKLNRDDYYIKDGKVYNKNVNEDLMKTYATLGKPIKGAEVKHRKSSVSIKINGETI